MIIDREVPENANIMIRRKFRGSLTFHKVIIGNKTRVQFDKKTTNNVVRTARHKRQIAAGQRTTHRRS